MAEDDDKSFQDCSGDRELSRDSPSDSAPDPAAAGDGEEKKKKKKAEWDGKCELNCFFSALTVSGAVVVAVAVGLFVSKKLKEK